MIDFEIWKNEIVDSINQLQEETKLIREFLEEENEEENEEEEINTEEDEVEEEEQETNEDEEELSELNNVDEIAANEIVILEKLDELNESLNLLNKTVVEGSLVVSISIVIALAFHYFMNQISKW